MIRKYAILVFIVILSSCEPIQDGNTSVLRLYGDALEDAGYSIAAADGGFVIGGQFTEVVRDGDYIQVENSSKKLGIIRTDIEGNEIWSQSFGGDKVAVGSKVIISDGSIVSTGYIVNEKTLKDIYVVKLSADGLVSTEMTYPLDGNQFGIDIIKTPEGFMVLGSTDLARGVKGDSIGNTAGKRDVYLLRINNNLEEIGSVAYGWPGNDAAVAIKTDKSGDFIITGTTDNSWPGQALNNIFIFKANPYGKVKEINIIGTAADEYSSDIEVLDDGFLIAGYVGSDGSEQSVYVVKLHGDIYEAPFFTHTFKVTSTGSSTATSFAVRAIGRYSTDSFVLAGQAGTGSSAKMLIFVIDGEGNQVTGKDMITTATGTQTAYDVISDDTDNIIAVGKNSFENNSMISFLKIRF